MNVGIDTLAIYTSRYKLDLADLAEARGVPRDKYAASLGQYTMAVPPPGEDIVTMAANAAQQALSDTDMHSIEMLLFATESGFDTSKAAGTYLHDLLKLPSRCRIVELKQACYGGTAGLQLAMPYLRENPTKKVLLVLADVARYGLHAAAESSQGAGAVAMVLSAQPRLIALEREYGVIAENVMDFWHPQYLSHALVDGKYSSKLYLQLLEKTWEQYRQLSGRELIDHDYFCYHTPVPRLVETAHQFLLKLSRQPLEPTQASLQAALEYGRHMGNSYTAALYVGLASLLDHCQQDLSQKRIGFYSYGSGCVAEYFSGVVQPGYQRVLHTAYHQQLFAERIPLTVTEYEAFYNYHYPEDGSRFELPVYQTGAFRLEKLREHKRIYIKTPLAVIDSNAKMATASDDALQQAQTN